MAAGDNGERDGDRYRCSRDSEEHGLVVGGGVVSASDVDVDVGVAVMIWGRGGIVGLVHYSFWIHPVSD